MEKVSDDIFCELCDSILDITRTIPKQELLDTDKDTEKDTEKSEDLEINYEDILKKVEAGEKISDDILRMIDLKELTKNDYYKKMAKKGDIKKSIMDMIDDMSNSDENTKAYMFCRNCSFSKTMKSGFKVLSKNPEGTASMSEYINESEYRVKAHMRTLPMTRNYNCPNKDCPTHKQKLAPEAVFFRKSSQSFELIYVCRRCLYVKVI